MPAVGVWIASVVSDLAGLVYGLLYLLVAIIYSIRQREFWNSESAEQKAQLAKVSHEFWSLERQHAPLSHNFITLPDTGKQLHYISHRTSNTSDLVIFLHGFPDTAYLWSRYVTYPVVSGATLVALDLPGCGGSDDLKRYGASEMLDCLGAAIVQLKSLYLGQGRTCVLVGHDWGGVIAFRLAADTKGLVNRVVVLNSAYPVAAAAALRNCMSKGVENLSGLRFEQAREALEPVWAQMRKSGYIYMFTLQFPIARYMPRVAKCLLKYVHGLEYTQKRQYSEELTLYLQASKLSAACGPGAIECRSTRSSGQAYGPSVYARSLTSPPGDWDQRVRIYSEGLARDKWIPTFAGYDSQKFDLESKDKFQCPVDIIFGLDDVALDPRIMLDGIENYFLGDGAQSSVLRLPNCGHWWVGEKTGAGAGAIAEVLHRVLGSEQP